MSSKYTFVFVHVVCVKLQVSICVPQMTICPHMMGGGLFLSAWMLVREMMNPGW